LVVASGSARRSAYAGPTTTLHKALAPTRLPNVRIHDPRHTYATLALKEGASVLEVSSALGHSKPTVTLNVYGHSSDEGQRKLATTRRQSPGPVGPG
jgi:integrase